MGIINHDSINDPRENGRTISNTYMSLGPNSNISLEKEGDQYTISGRFIIYKDQESRNNTLSNFGNKYIMKNMSISDLDQNLVSFLYTELKNIYTNTTDV